MLWSYSGFPLQLSFFLFISGTMGCVQGPCPGPIPRVCPVQLPSQGGAQRACPTSVAVQVSSPKSTPESLSGRGCLLCLCLPTTLAVLVFSKPLWRVGGSSGHSATPFPGKSDCSFLEHPTDHQKALVLADPLFCLSSMFSAPHLRPHECGHQRMSFRKTIRPCMAWWPVNAS